MFASPLGFGATQDFASQPQSQSPEKRARQEDKQTCLPATCRLLLDSVAKQSGDKEVLVHGQEVANVVLVGVVEELSQGAVLEFTLNDGTGRLKVRYYQNDGQGLDGIAAGRYVSVVGMLRPSPSLHISAMTLRPVTSADEVSYHTIEVAHVALMLRNGGSKAPAAKPSTQSAVSQASVAVAKPSQEGVQAAAPVSVAAPAGAVKSLTSEAVMEVLRREIESKPEGVPLSLLCEQFKGSSESEVKAALEKLVDEGDVFNTIDDVHFQPL